MSGDHLVLVRYKTHEGIECRGTYKECVEWCDWNWDVIMSAESWKVIKADTREEVPVVFSILNK